MTGYRGRIARSLVSARESADVSQRELAERLGHDKRTVQKWESGEMKISLEDFLEIFDALHVAVEPYSKWIRHPELFPNGLADINKFNHDKCRTALVHYYARQASPVEVEQEYYFLFASHGSSIDGMYQQWMANLMTPLRDRKRICSQVIDNYSKILDEIEKVPNVKIYLMAYYPVNYEAAAPEMKECLKIRTNEKIAAANAEVKKLAERHGQRYIDISRNLKDEQGRLKAEYTIEGMHIKEEGYRAIYDDIMKYVKE